MSAWWRHDEPGADGARVGARLVPLEDADSEIIPLTGSPLVVGRAADCGLVCLSPGLSRHHARISSVRGTWFIEDLESANGTTVDGQPAARTKLKQGCVICFGRGASYRFQLVEAASARSSFLNLFFCLQLKPVAAGRPFILQRPTSLIGRNANADLRLDQVQISGIHARILRRGARVVIQDISSRNGTMVNGEVVHEAVLLPGDRVALGDVEYTVGRSLVPTARALAGVAVGVLVVALATVSLVMIRLQDRDVEPLWTREMYVDQVTASLVAGVRAHDRQPPAREVALAQVGVARRSLIAADLLRPDRQTPAEVMAAMAEAARAPEVVRALKGRGIGAVVAEIEREPAVEPPVRQRPAFDLTAELSDLVAGFGIDTRDTPIPEDLVRNVEHFTRYWSVERRDYTLRSRQRGMPLLADLRQALRSQRLPEIFCYLPFIESGYQSAAKSTAGAVGLWQLMPGTARDYGLSVDNPDERTDPALSTLAACRHLEMLLDIFGPESFICAVAAYNKGHNGLRKCMAESGDLKSPWRFWDLVTVKRECLPQETIEYVPRFLAAVVVFRNAEHFGLPEFE
jgi:pSer/pThr/pTyr-binding forkhead associated (FHA) protein